MIQSITFVSPQADLIALLSGERDKNMVKNTWDDWHILPTSRPVFAPPEVKTSYIDIPGGNGKLDLSESLSGYPIYNNRTGSFTFRVMNDHNGWADHYSNIMNFLHGRVMRAILEDDKEWFYQGRFTIEDWKSADTWSEITIGYDVNPFKWNLVSSTDPWLWDPFNFETGIICEPTFKSIEVDSPDVWTDVSFNADFFGLVPTAPTITVMPLDGVDGTTYTGMQIRFVNVYLGIDIELHFDKGTIFVPDFIFYGQTEQYKMYFNGQGKVSIDFRVGRL